MSALPCSHAHVAVQCWWSLVIHQWPSVFIAIFDRLHSSCHFHALQNEVLFLCLGVLQMAKCIWPVRPP
jgi:uncharacterized membrane protein